MNSVNVSCPPEMKQFLDKLCTEKGVECKPPRTTARLLDKVNCPTALYWVEVFVLTVCLNNNIYFVERHIPYCSQCFILNIHIQSTLKINKTVVLWKNEKLS